VFSLKESKLVKKIKRLLKQAGLPRWLHRFGPKKFEFWQHFMALLVKESCKMSYRRVSKFLNELGFRVPTYSALAKMVKRLPGRLLQLLLAATTRFKQVIVAAADATFFPRTNPSFHYLKRCKRKMPLKKAVQLTALFDTRRKQWLAASPRLKRASEPKQAIRLLEQPFNIKNFVGDKANDSEELFKALRKRGVQAHVPVKKNIRRGLQRKFFQARFRTRTYHRRSLVEAGFSSLKRKHGASVSNKRVRTIKNQLMFRLINQNAKILPNRKDFQQSPFDREY